MKKSQWNKSISVFVIHRKWYGNCFINMKRISCWTQEKHRPKLIIKFDQICFLLARKRNDLIFVIFVKLPSLSVECLVLRPFISSIMSPSSTFLLNVLKKNVNRINNIVFGCKTHDNNWRWKATVDLKMEGFAISSIFITRLEGFCGLLRSMDLKGCKTTLKTW